MAHSTDIKIKNVELYFLPVQTRVPLKFGSETLNRVTCARARVTVEDAQGNSATGWGETPLSIQWVWPSTLPYSDRHDDLKAFCKRLAEAWNEFDSSGHPLEIGHDFLEHRLPIIQNDFNRDRASNEPMPYLASLVAASVFDQAIHDAFGVLHGIDIYQTYNAKFMTRTLSDFLEPNPSQVGCFDGKFPGDYLIKDPPTKLPVWHLVGGLDPLTKSELTGDEPQDGYPVLLQDWIKRDGLTCLKVKLRGNDATWDYQRLESIGQLSLESGVKWLTADFNCMVHSPDYVIEILDRLASEHPQISDMILYVEQPFPYDLEKYRIDAHAVSERKPLFLDESAHDWKYVRLGQELGWSGVALKTCKTQTGALLSACWAKAHGMPLMVQDLTNPMLAQIPHVRLAAHVGTIMGVESNAMQFYPDASLIEQAVHPGLYQRRNGQLDLSTISGPGFGYRVDEINRELGEDLLA
ncbi:MAG: L-alanine-DL-glutamate epimerase-like enolase superfamily enzyme [Mariniblastus sp.]|jgi:L-alanine-DL-glutamate epimerase-like enolase superfamily enzyme